MVANIAVEGQDGQENEVISWERAKELGCKDFAGNTTILTACRQDGGVAHQHDGGVGAVGRRAFKLGQCISNFSGDTVGTILAENAVRSAGRDSRESPGNQFGQNIGSLKQSKVRVKCKTG